MTEMQGKGTKLRQKWDRLITSRRKDLKEFHDTGDTIVDTYRIEKRNSAQRDKYNILYSNTETVKPALYAQTPKVEVERTQVDKSNVIARAACEVLEYSLDYQLREQADDFDAVIGDVVQDSLLPGFGQVWVRYVPTWAPMTDDNGPVMNDQGEQEQEVAYETTQYDYVFWKDFLWSKGRRWSEVWWVARRTWMDKADYTKRFGKQVAGLTTFTTSRQVDAAKNDDEEFEAGQAEVWEIWDKKSKTRIMFCPTYGKDVLESEPDPLRLQKFFPCPRPLFAITSTNKTIPRPYYAQYQAQADELNDITCRIRLLVDALRVIGVYDASVDGLKGLLQGTGNKMMPVEGWSTIAEKGGLKGTVDFVPISEVAQVLMQLYDGRDRVKAEIYEITGWSDIIRGVSKASETLGAQKLKSEWAGARLKLQQRDVQRFIRDILQIAGEIISEHFSPQSLAMMCGLEYTAVNDEMREVFGQVVQLLKDQKQRCSAIKVETDSTLMPDEANDKAERMEFVGAAGAFLQQAVPAMQTMPSMGPLLAHILMFAVRSFRGARSMEQYFDEFIEQMQSGGIPPPQGKPGEGGGTDPAVEQGKQQTALAALQHKSQAEGQKAQLKGAELQQDDRHHTEDLELERQAENNRHMEKMEELRIRGIEAEAKLQALADKARSEEAKVALAATSQSVDEQFRARDADRADRSENSPEGD